MTSPTSSDSSPPSRGDRDRDAGATSPAARPADGPTPSDVDSPYARYVLGVLVVVYTFNFLDRQILAILANDIKADLGLDDADLGFLYGTAFAVFYAVFGIPLGRLADVWNRRSLIAIGLAFWSAMTAVSGLARSFLQLAIPRIGVGIGEASASPSAYSMLSDYFRPSLRATALAIYSSGIYIGAGLGLMVGGQVAERWNNAWETPPFGLVGWQVAFFAVGLPGILLALWVRTLREPVRGQVDGILTPPHPQPFHAFLRELLAVLPPLTVLSLVLAGGGRRGLVSNLIAAAAIAALSAVLVVTTGDTIQWVAFGAGVYASVSWAQTVALRDRPTFTLIFRSRSLRYAILGFSGLAFTSYAVSFWTVAYLGRAHDVTLGELGLWAGVGTAIGGWLGVVLGGVLADRLCRHTPNGRLYIGVIAATVPVPLAVWLLFTSSITTAYILNGLLAMLTPMWLGPAAATVQELVLPRMRALASAFYLLVATFIGLALGPYVVGTLSDTLGAASGDPQSGLRSAMLIAMAANGVALGFLLLAMRYLADEQATIAERARAAGEDV